MNINFVTTSAVEKLIIKINKYIYQFKRVIKFISVMQTIIFGILNKITIISNFLIKNINLYLFVLIFNSLSVYANCNDIHANDEMSLDIKNNDRIESYMYDVTKIDHKDSKYILNGLITINAVSYQLNECTTTNVGDILSGPDIYINLTEMKLFLKLKSEPKNCSELKNHFRELTIHKNGKSIALISIDDDPSNKGTNEMVKIKGGIYIWNTKSFYKMNYCLKDPITKLYHLSGDNIDVNLGTGFTAIY